MFFDALFVGKSDVRSRGIRGTRGGNLALLYPCKEINPILFQMTTRMSKCPAPPFPPTTNSRRLVFLVYLLTVTGGGTGSCPGTRAVAAVGVGDAGRGLASVTPAVTARAVEMRIFVMPPDAPQAPSRRKCHALGRRRATDERSPCVLGHEVLQERKSGGHTCIVKVSPCQISRVSSNLVSKTYQGSENEGSIAMQQGEETWSRRGWETALSVGMSGTGRLMLEMVGKEPLSMLP